MNEVNELQTFPDFSDHAASDASQHYLTIEQINDVEPLDAQFGVWPLKNAPDTLYEPLFGSLPPNEADNTQGTRAEDTLPMNTYAILDGAKLPHILTGQLDTSDLRYQSLFQGETQDDLQEYAPYLVELDADNSWTRHLFSSSKNAFGLWEKELGIFLRSRASFEDLRNHLRKFVQIQDESKKWIFFRFWEPISAAVYFKVISTNAERSLRWFQLRNGEKIDAIIAPNAKTGEVTIFRPKAFANPDHLVTSPFVLGNPEYMALKAARFEEDINQMVAHLQKTFPDCKARMGKSALDKAVRRSVSRMMDFGIKQKRNVLYLAALDLHLMGAFERADPAGELRKILEMQTSETDKMLRLEKRIHEMDA